MRTNLSSCLGLCHIGQSTNRLLVLVPHEGTHGTMCLIKKLRMFRPKITKMRAIKKAMPLIPDSPGGAKGASALRKNGIDEISNIFLVPVPHQALHGIMCIMQQVSKTCPGPLKEWALQHVVPLIPRCMLHAQSATAKKPGDDRPGHAPLLKLARNASQSEIGPASSAWIKTAASQSRALQ